MDTSSIREKLETLDPRQNAALIEMLERQLVAMEGNEKLSISAHVPDEKDETAIASARGDPPSTIESNYVLPVVEELPAKSDVNAVASMVEKPPPTIEVSDIEPVVGNMSEVEANDVAPVVDEQSVGSSVQKTVTLAPAAVLPEVQDPGVLSVSQQTSDQEKGSSMANTHSDWVDDLFEDDLKLKGSKDRYQELIEKIEEMRDSWKKSQQANCTRPTSQSQAPLPANSLTSPPDSYHNCHSVEHDMLRDESTVEERPPQKQHVRSAVPEPVSVKSAPVPAELKPVKPMKAVKVVHQAPQPTPKALPVKNEENLSTLMQDNGIKPPLPQQAQPKVEDDTTESTGSDFLAWGVVGAAVLWSFSGRNKRSGEATTHHASTQNTGMNYPGPVNTSPRRSGRSRGFKDVSALPNFNGRHSID